MTKIILPEAPKLADATGMPVISCGRCKFFVAGGCHKNPPMPFPVGTDGRGQPMVMGFWSPVGATDWCGSFERSVLTAGSATEGRA